MTLNFLSKMSFFNYKNKTRKKKKESKPEGVFTHYTAFFPDCFIHQHLKMQRSPLGNQDCSGEGGVSGGVDTPDGNCGGESSSQSPSSESNLKSCRISLRASLFLMILDTENTAASSGQVSTTLTTQTV